jgi:hypothetical protein
MRLICGLAIALCLNFPSAGMASRPQDASAAGQTPAVPAPAESSPPADKKTSKNVAKKSAAKKTMDAGSATASAKHHQRKPLAPDGAPKKVVVREGGASEPAAQIAPGMTPAEAASERQNAERWLGSTDNQLKLLSVRTLDSRQQETVGQIHNYVDGAHSALKEGDVRRASTLAEKAHLLAEDLVKR